MNVNYELVQKLNNLLNELQVDFVYIIDNNIIKITIFTP